MFIFGTALMSIIYMWDNVPKLMNKPILYDPIMVLVYLIEL